MKKQLVTFAIGLAVGLALSLGAQEGATDAEIILADAIEARGLPKSESLRLQRRWNSFAQTASQQDVALLAIAALDLTGKKQSDDCCQTLRANLQHLTDECNHNFNEIDHWSNNSFATVEGLAQLHHPITLKP